MNVAPTSYLGRCPTLKRPNGISYSHVRLRQVRRNVWHSTCALIVVVTPDGRFVYRTEKVLMMLVAIKRHHSDFTSISIDGACYIDAKRL